MTSTHGGARPNSGRPKRTWPKNCAVVYQVVDFYDSSSYYYQHKRDVLSKIGDDNHSVYRLVVYRPTTVKRICNLLNQVAFVAERECLWDGPQQLLAAIEKEQGDVEEV